mmetsp:Transcript_33626/g.73595  ORF Transcript_33626/g.73595 Transcript_33626/m.73595 type:complete len:105 (-) Transcript_33626:224-538(-)
MVWICCTNEEENSESIDVVAFTYAPPSDFEVEDMDLIPDELPRYVPIPEEDEPLDLAAKGGEEQEEEENFVVQVGRKAKQGKVGHGQQTLGTNRDPENAARAGC